MLLKSIGQDLKKWLATMAIRPVVYDSFRRIDFPHEFTEYLRTFCIAQTVQNLYISVKLKHILNILTQYKIRVYPYKGLYFVDKLYNNQPLRKIGDLDIWVHPDTKSLIKALSYPNIVE
jgi:Uncharacterised nucleotidyltransferase